MLFYLKNLGTTLYLASFPVAIGNFNKNPFGFKKISDSSINHLLEFLDIFFWNISGNFPLLWSLLIGFALISFTIFYLNWGSLLHLLAGKLRENWLAVLSRYIWFIFLYNCIILLNIEKGIFKLIAWGISFCLNRNFLQPELEILIAWS